MNGKRVTTKSEAVTSNNTCLNDGILLSGEGFGGESQLGQEPGPSLNEKKPQQTSCNVQRRNNTNRQIELVGDDAEQTPEHRTHHQPSDSDLVLPFRDMLGFRGLGLVRIKKQRFWNIHGWALSSHDRDIPIPSGFNQICIGSASTDILVQDRARDQWLNELWDRVRYGKERWQWFWERRKSKSVEGLVPRQLDEDGDCTFQWSSDFRACGNQLVQRSEENQKRTRSLIKLW